MSATLAFVTIRMWLELEYQTLRLEDSVYLHVTVVCTVLSGVTLCWRIQMLILTWIICCLYFEFYDIFLFLQCQCKLIKRGKGEVDYDGENVTTSTA